MTAQIGDIYKYQGKDYTLVESSAANPFHPKNFGMEPHPSCTACYRGYWCEYAVIEDELVLKNLYFFNIDGNYPPLNGTEVSPQEYVECVNSAAKSKKRRIITIPAYMGHRVYKDVNLLIPYTGTLLLGDGFMGEFYINYGFQEKCSHKKLLELVFEDGLLMECNDLSQIAQAKREAIMRGDIVED